MAYWGDIELGLGYLEDEEPDERYCQAPGCERPVRGRRQLCAGHEKRRLRHGDAGTLDELRQALDLEGWLVEVALRYADQRERRKLAGRSAPMSEQERAAVRVARADAEDDQAFERAREALLRACRIMGHRLRQGGRPRAIRGDVIALVRKHGGVRAAARALGVSHVAVIKAMRRDGNKPKLPPRRTLA